MDIRFFFKLNLSLFIPTPIVAVPKASTGVSKNAVCSGRADAGILFILHFPAIAKIIGYRVENSLSCLCFHELMVTVSELG